MKNLMYGVCMLGGLLALSACNDDNPWFGSDGQGRIRPFIGVDGAVVDAVPTTRADEAEPNCPDVSQLSLTLTKQDGSYSRTWESPEHFDESQEFGVGAYNFSASYGSPDAEGFQSPYYYGETVVNVTEGEVSEVHLTASLANAMISIEFTPAFKNFFPQYSSQMHSNGGDFIVFEADENRPAYLKPGNIAVIIDVTKQNGLHATLQPAAFDAQPRHHYHVTYDVTDAQGDAQLVVKFDDSIVTEDIYIDLSDQFFMAPAPSVIADGFQFGTPVQTVEGAPTPSPAKMTLKAMGGFNAVTLTTQSDYLISRGWPAEIDLMNASEEQKQLLASMGLGVNGLWGKTSQLAQLDFTNVPTHISGASTSEFTVVVKDMMTKINENPDQTNLIIQTQPITLKITEAPSIPIGDTEATLTLSYNGSDLEQHLTMQYFSFGAWQPASVKSVVNNGDGTYRVTISFNNTENEVKVRALYNGNAKDEATIQRTGVRLAYNEINVWSKKAAVAVTPANGLDGTTAKFFVATGNGNYSEWNNLTRTSATAVTLTGLTPGLTYSVKAGEAADKCGNVITFSTDPASQLANSDCETWYNSASARNYVCMYLGSDTNTIWGTNNPLTTAAGTDLSYQQISGTLNTSDAHSGNNAALIRTVGYGRLNTAAGSLSICYNCDRGVLHTGNSRSQSSDVFSTDGISFNSRPSALNFYYKYTPKNTGDKGQALITVYGTDNSVIAIGKVDLTSVNSYTLKQVPLTYSSGAAKAARIYVCFQSNVEDSFLAINRNNLNYPGVGSGSFVGSQLFIDDISLSYDY